MRFTIILIILCSLIIFTSCEKENVKIENDNDSPNLEIDPTGDDEDKIPLPDKPVTDHDILPDKDIPLPADDDVIIPIDEDVIKPMDDDVVVPNDDDVIEPMDDDVFVPADDDVIEPMDNDVVEPSDDIVVPDNDVIEPSDDDAVINDEDSTTIFDPDGDDDLDGIPNSVECPSGIPCRDSDFDGIPDYLDTDSDNDGIEDSVEAGADPSNPVDTDNDGIPDYLDTDSDDDGIPDEIEGNLDFDNDGIPNYQDIDSDNDGFSDADEAGADPSNPVDTDGDGYPDFVDLDSDGDGLTDAKEHELGSDPTLVDSDGDGYDDSTEFAYWTEVEPANVGANITDASKKLPDDIFYFILPYQDPSKSDELEFATNIQKADIMIQIDLSYSMQDEITNLKNELSNTVIPGIASKIPNAAFGLGSFGTVQDSPYTLDQSITDVTTDVQSAVNGLSLKDGQYEMHIETLYQGATGEGLVVTNSGCEGGTFDLIAASNPAYRDDSLPIYIMITDEYFSTPQEIASGTGLLEEELHTVTDATTAMNAINAKFIGIDTSGEDQYVLADYTTIADATESVDEYGDPFYYNLETDGTTTGGASLADQMVDAVTELSSNIQIDIVTDKQSVENDFSIDTSLFIKSIIPNYTDPPGAYGSKDQSQFFDVKPGTKVYFDITAENDFFEPTTTESTLFKATIRVKGEGTILSTRHVYIIVPGKNPTGGSE